MMYPLIIASVVLIALAIERLVTLRKASTDGELLLDEIKENYQPGGDTQKAIAICDEDKSALGRMIARGLKNAGRPADSIEMAMEQEAANESPTLEANLTTIKTIVNIAPLLGLLGTIAGMIGSFRSASANGLSNPNQILGGISEALVATATGITLAMLGFLFYNYFANLSKKIQDDMEFYGAEFVNYTTGRVD